MELRPSPSQWRAQRLRYFFIFYYIFTGVFSGDPHHLAKILCADLVFTKKDFIF
jgi:hypothetical protein